MNAKKNCWEVKNCGRQSGGAKVAELGVCPVAQPGNLEGVHGGVRSGRACWMVAGSLCGGEVQGTFAHKVANCLNCDFYKKVLIEEGERFLSPSKLLGMAQKPG